MKELKVFVKMFRAYYSALDSYSKGKLLAEISHEIMQELESCPQIAEVWVKRGIGDEIGVNLSVITDKILDYIVALGTQKEKEYEKGN